MNVGVDDAREDVQPGGVDSLAGAALEVGLDRRDLAVHDSDIPIRAPSVVITVPPRIRRSNLLNRMLPSTGVNSHVPHDQGDAPPILAASRLRAKGNPLISGPAIPDDHRRKGS